MTPAKFIISFSGVDGAGKTTVLRIVKDKLSAGGLELVELRSRPSILPILSSLKYGKKKAEENASISLPRKGKNNSKLSSYLRFFYYLTDYVLGQFYIDLRYTRRGYVVMYDRFYFDYIVDPLRANLVINHRVARFFFRFIKEPHLNIFLYAPVETITHRKQELDSSAILELTQGYMSLFEQLERNSNSKYLCVQNIELSETISKIDEYIPGF